MHSGEELDIRWGSESEEMADGSALLAKALRAATHENPLLPR